MHTIPKCLLLLGLAGCGAPGADSIFTKGKANVTADSSRTIVEAPPQRWITRSYRGFLQPSGDDPKFRPCGTPTLLDVDGVSSARNVLKERYRWNTSWAGSNKMFAQFQGDILTDTQRVRDPVTGVEQLVPRTRFYVVDVESLRTWMSSDCNGMRVP